jgi:hypothetical protein
MEIVEDWTINQSGSGHLQLTINASESRVQIRASNVGDTTHARIRTYIAQTKSTFPSTTIEEDWNSYIFRIRIPFTDISTFNTELTPTLNTNLIERDLSVTSSTRSKWVIIVRSDKELVSKDTTYKRSTSRKAVMKTIHFNSTLSSDLGFEIRIKN